MAVISVSYLHASNLSLYFGYLEVVSSSSDLHRESADVPETEPPPCRKKIISSVHSL